MSSIGLPQDGKQLALHLAQTSPVGFGQALARTASVPTPDAVSGDVASPLCGAAEWAGHHPGWNRWFEDVMAYGGLNLVAGPTGNGEPASIIRVAAELEARGEVVYAVGSDELDEFEGSYASVLLVPEIRSKAGAASVVRLAQDGYTVVGSIHGSSAQAAFNRLLELGVSVSKLRECLSTLFAQRLVWSPFAAGAGPESARTLAVSELATFEASGDFDRFEAGLGAWRTLQQELEAMVEQGQVHPGELDGSLVKNPMRTISWFEFLYLLNGPVRR